MNKIILSEKEKPVFDSMINSIKEGCDIIKTKAHDVCNEDGSVNADVIEDLLELTWNLNSKANQITMIFDLDSEDE